MSKILDLAKDFEEKSKQQVNDTEQQLKNVLTKHLNFIEGELELSKRKTKDDIQRHHSNLTWLVLKTWLWLPLTVFLVIAAAWGTIQVQSRMIVKHYLEIADLKNMISSHQNEIEKLTNLKRVQMSHCDGHLCVKIDPKFPEYKNNQEFTHWRVIAQD